MGGDILDIDKNLISRCKKYDKSALIELFEIYEKYLYKLCYSYTQSEPDALDLVQEIYIKIFNNINKFDESMPFHPWLRRISINTCLNFKRTIKSNVISLNEDFNKDFTLEDTIASNFNVEDEIEKIDLKRIIKENLKTLPENYRLAIILRYYENLSYAEIAELICKPLGTVKTEIYRAKSLLKKKLEHILEE